MANAADVPARPDGLELIGEMVGSGYRNPPSLVRRADGQTLQLTPLLYAVLEAVDGRRGYVEIAEHVSGRTGRSVAASDIQSLVERQLRPQGLLLLADGSAPELKRSNPLLGLRFKLAVTNPAATRRITEPFTVLFHPLVWVPLLLVFMALSWWLLIDHGLASATYQAFAKPSLLLLIVAITVLSAGFHEFGHAAAARRGGAQPGVMGAGLYLMFPAFYTDVTDSYRLGRFGRIRTDLGGLYFNVIVAVGIAAVWWFTRWDALLLVVAAQILQMIRQLTPLVRFDGYHVLADLTGVPDLFSRIGPILASFLPKRPPDPRVTQLKRWARVLVTAWVLVVVPVLLFSLVGMVLAAPRIVGTAWESLGRQRVQMAQEWGAGQSVDAIGSGLAMAAISLAILAMGLMGGRIVVSSLKSLWRRTEGNPVRRAGAGVLVAAMAVALAFAWWPSPQRYRPIQPFERGSLVDLAAAPLAAVGYRVPAAPAATGGEITTVLPRSGALPTEGHPELALVLVPAGTDGGGGGNVKPAWVFPFNEPLPPGPGDNQAKAVNTTSGSASYNVAVAMVWVTGNDPVLNTNEAYAFASCSNCVTVAVAFQVVVIVGNANVIVPQNLAGSVNYKCFECITRAIASQLVVTIDSVPGAKQQLALADVWANVAAFAKSIPTLPLADVIARLEDYKAQILQILNVALPAAAASPGPSGSSVPPSTSPGAGLAGSPAPGTSEAPPSPPPGTPAATGATGPTPAATSEPSPSSDPAAPSPTPLPQGASPAAP